MALSTNPLFILKNPKVREYFVNILQSNLSGNDKYEQLIDFFELEGRVTTEMLNSLGDELWAGKAAPLGEIASAAGQRLGIWKPDEILAQTHESIMRALRRLKNSQHRDGGWGFQPEVSGAWATAFAVLCLHAANQANDFNLELGDNLNKGLSWLKQHQSTWGIEKIDKNTSKSAYDLSIVIRCCYEVGAADLSSLDREWRKLSELQNKDGGWDARVWAADYAGLTKVFSDVGATRMALQALATVNRYEESNQSVDFNSIFRKGMKWFVRTQNEDGSWNNKSSMPGIAGIDGYPSITKTCDGIKGILTAVNSIPKLRAAEIALTGDAVEKAVQWLLGQETALHDQEGNIAGWGWGDELIGDFKIDEMQNTWLTLETLVQVDSPSISLPRLVANARWMMKQQHQPTAGEDPIEDGKWEPVGHTARIALSLIEFYKKINGSPLFEKVNEEEPVAAKESDVVKESAAVEESA